MKNWKEEYKKKIKSKEEAISTINSETRVVFGHAAGEPIPLVDELVRQRDRLQNVEIVEQLIKVVKIGNRKKYYNLNKGIFPLFWAKNKTPRCKEWIN